MFTLRHLLALVIVPTCMQMPAWAQVQRCTDATGHTTYTDGPCDKGQRSVEVLPQPSTEERALQNYRYQQALERRREEQALQLQRDAARQAELQAQAAARAAQRPMQPVVVEVTQPAPEPTVVYYPASPPRLPPHAQPPRPPLPAGGHQCNVFRCYDGKGNTWARP